MDIKVSNNFMKLFFNDCDVFKTTNQVEVLDLSNASSIIPILSLLSFQNLTIHVVEGLNCISTDFFDKDNVVIVTQ